MRSELAEDRRRGAWTSPRPTQDVTQLQQALRPSDLASEVFAAIGVLLGLLLAFNALLLTVPERRQAIADLRLTGIKRTAVVQMVLFQALCLGLAATARRPARRLRALDRGLSPADRLPGGGVHALQRHRRRRARRCSSPRSAGCSRRAWPPRSRCSTCAAAARATRSTAKRACPATRCTARRTAVRCSPPRVLLVALAGGLFARAPSAAIASCAMLAAATVLAVPLTFAAVLRAGRAARRALPAPDRAAGRARLAARDHGPLAGARGHRRGRAVRQRRAGRIAR